ncbi:MAG: FAA hydrolase family protein [Rhodanobacteraceae bacterium]|nr:MAG: FAA hydrolase family protein [Rhodanobacteraceae bacterium]
MKLATLREGSRDGTLIVVSRDLVHGVRVRGIVPTLQCALDDWAQVAPRLESVYAALNQHPTHTVQGAFALDVQALAAPFPRAYEFLDGSSYLAHVERVRQARGATVPETFYTDPLMYQATCGGFLAARDPIVIPDDRFGLDLEAEVIVVTDDVPMATDAAQASSHIRLLGLVNDVSLRNLIPVEIAKSLGFVQSKPRSALSPVLATPDELGTAWAGDKVHLPMRTWINGKWFGAAEAGEDMQFNFAQLIAHAARTRPLVAGTLIGSGTVANHDTAKGNSCIAGRRSVETLHGGAPVTPFLRYGDTVKIDMLDRDGRSIFGAIDQCIRPLAE